MASTDPDGPRSARQPATARLSLPVSAGQEQRWAVQALQGEQISLRRTDGHPVPQFAPGSVIDLSWQDVDERVHLELRATVRQRDEIGLQLQLAGMDDWQHEQLSRLQQQSGAAREADSGPGEEVVRRAVEALARVLRSDLPPRIERLFLQCELSLDPVRMDFAREIGGIPLADAEQRLSAVCASISAATVASLTQQLESPGRQISRSRRPNALRLVDDEEMQVWLNRSESLRRLERDAKASWHALRPLLGELQQAEPERDPDLLAAEALLDALLDATRGVALESPLQQLVMRHAARPDTLDVPGLYVALQMALLRAGLRAPQRAASVAQPAAASAAGPQRVPLAERSAAGEAARQTGDATEPEQTPADAAAQADPSAGLPRFAAVAPASAAGASSSRHSPAQGASEVDASAAMEAARRLWSLAAHVPDPSEDGAPISDDLLREAVRRAAEGDDHSFRERLASAAAELGGEALQTDPRQTEAVELLARLNQALGADPLLSRQFRTWSRPLLAPILGAQLRPEGLGENGETIRHLLELLEFGSVVCAQRDDAPTRELRERIGQLVASLGELPALVAPDLDAAAEQLEKLLQRHRRAGTAIEDRVVEACVGQQRLVEARRLVDEELTERFAGRQLPPALGELLEDRLHALLVLTVLREGANSEAWAAQRARLQVLEQALDAQLEPAQRQAAAESSLAWIEELGAGQSGEQAIVGQQLDAIAQALRADSPDGAAWAGREKPPAPLLAGLDETADQHARQLRLIQPGDWVAFDIDGGEPRLLKLAWHAPDRQRLVFVSQLGHRAEDLSDAELLELLRGGRARLLEDGKSTVVERAWRRMLEGLHDELAEQASRDQLTGLINRKELDRRLLTWINARHRPALALLWVGADYQRMLNQSLGMEGGDFALSRLAEALAQLAHEQDAERAYAARIAGDEFVVVLPRADSQLADQFAERLLDRLGSLEPLWQGRKFRLSASIGIVVADENCSGGDALLRDAERACGAAKELGRGRSYVHQADDFRLSQMRETVDWVGRVEQSLEQGHLVLFGQRALSLSDKAKAGPDYLEVLLRMRDADGLSTPQNFIIAAERYGQITAIDRFVLQQLGLHLMASDASKRFRIAFNLSAHNVVDPEFITEIIQTLRAQPQPLHQLCIELTETAAIQQLASASEGMRRLSEAGIAMVLDDFGSGWSSYNYLRRLPVDIVKVDGAFIKDIATSPQDLALARSINEVAHMLGKMTVAEHVENEETLSLVREIGFDYAQGYLVERPRPLTEHLD